MAIRYRTLQIPDFVRTTRSAQLRQSDQHNPYQPLAALYLLRLALGLRNHLADRSLSELFVNDLGSLTGLADSHVPGINYLKNGELFLDDDDDMLLSKAAKTDMLTHIRHRLKKWLDNGMAVKEPLFSNLKLLADKLNLNATEQEILVVRLLFDLFPSYTQFICEHCNQCTPAKLYHYLHILTTRPHADIEKALRPSSRLCQLGWIKVTPTLADLEDKLCLSQGLLEILITEHESLEALFTHFFTLAKPSTLQLADYAHLDNDLEVSVAHLQTALEKRQAGVNLLIYGMPGAGKTELAKLLAKTVGAALFEVCYADKDGNAVQGNARFAACKLTQQLLAKKRQPSLILFDEAEDVFPCNSASFFFDDEAISKGDKAWINHQLENNPVPVIWIVNKTQGMDAAYLRRFDYSIEIDKMPINLRRRLINKYTKGLNIDPAWCEQLARHTDITPAQIAKAGAIAKGSQKKTTASAEQIMERVLNASMRLLKQSPGLIKERCWSGYDLGFTNTDAQFPQLVAGLKLNPRGTFCFYGAPGTGKTALANYIAETLGLPILIKRASDLLDKYVGESEKNIAQMFDQAQRQGGILLLDEADSLLSDRRDAANQWEVTLVNEMLTQMEHFTGIFICTTNLMEKLDSASLRRFDFKVKFDYLSPEQRWALFQQESQRLGSTLPKDTETLAVLKQQIHSLTKLTPGDFSVVSRQVAMLGMAPEPERIIAVLAQECKAKGESFSQIGFVH